MMDQINPINGENNDNGEKNDSVLPVNENNENTVDSKVTGIDSDKAQSSADSTPVDTAENSAPVVTSPPVRKPRPKGDTLYSDSRTLAVKILTRVERTDSYLEKLIDYEIKTEQLNDYDKSLLNEICHGVIRWMRRLDWFLNGFYRGQWEKCMPEIKNTLRVALYQILFLNKIPDYAAVNEATEFVKRISTQKHADVVNGLLRTIIRTKEELVYPTREIDEIKYLGIMQSHPNWMVKRWIQRFGFDDAEKLTEANNKRPILTIRINTLKTSKDDFLKRLSEKNILYRFCRHIDNFVTLRLMSKIYLDEDFINGSYAVQDESAGLVSVLLNANENDVILDMCAAPGGKSTHISQLLNNKGKIFAIDKYDAKLRTMKENANRLGVTNIEFVQDDASDFHTDIITSERFDKILLDAPCSGLGVLSKKPDIRWKREIEDILGLAKFQKKLLNNAAKYLKPTGVIVYSTCTIEPEENMEVIKDFLEHHSEFRIDDASKYIGKDLVNQEGCIETFPHRHGIDGSFAVRLVRQN